LPHQLSSLRDRIGISVKVRPIGSVRSDFFTPVPILVVKNSDRFHLCEISFQGLIVIATVYESKCRIWRIFFRTTFSFPCLLSRQERVHLIRTVDGKSEKVFFFLYYLWDMNFRNLCLFSGSNQAFLKKTIIITETRSRYKCVQTRNKIYQKDLNEKKAYSITLGNFQV
jgi:hypothetical protein